MPNSIGIFKIYPESFKANVYTTEPFRMIGLIDVGIIYIKTIETVTLAFFRSSGTNSGKIKGLWYPIIGIKTTEGSFTEFTQYINFVLTRTTPHGKARKGWLAKSLFFDKQGSDRSKLRGFSSGMHYKSLLWIGETLRDLYEQNKFEKMSSLNAKSLNKILTSKEVYKDNKRTQRGNFEHFVEDIFKKD